MSLAFGTSGIRGLATDFTSQECHWFVTAFVEHLKLIGKPPHRMMLAGDFRESTPRILSQVAASLKLAGCESHYCGQVPTPTLAYACFTQKTPGIMVTGSHIPGDRNGIKFYFEDGEILKKDEVSILSLYTRLKGEIPNPALELAPLPAPRTEYSSSFVERYTALFPHLALDGLRVLFFEHSSAAKNLLPEILEKLGAKVNRFGATPVFTPVDTEAVENVTELRKQLLNAKADALVSTDGDADRPMMLDETGELIPGDLIGLLAARSLGAKAIVVPVSCNTALEASGAFAEVHRTRIGSPFVLEKMLELGGMNPEAKVAGFEANGGFMLAPLMTRDSILPVLLCLAEIKRQKAPLSALLAKLPARFTCSGLIRGVPPENSRKILNQLSILPIGAALSSSLLPYGKISSVDQTDGTRFSLAAGSDKNQNIVHFRPSGNAPEFRIYAESHSKKAAKDLCDTALAWVRSLSDPPGQ